MLTVQRWSDPEEFGAAIEPLIRRDPVGATMVAHVLAGHLAHPYPGGAPLMLGVFVDGGIALAALRTSGHPVLVVVDPGIGELGVVLDRVVPALAESAEPVVGFSGRTSTVQPLADAWTRYTGFACGIRMSTLFYRLASLVEPSGVAGSARAAVLTDENELDLLAGWLDDFGRETGVSRGLPAPDRAMILANAGRGQLSVLWCVDGMPVALAGHSAVRNRVVRIAPVYTPPGHRRRGYGAAVTAAAVRSARELGASEITLFADADYPPANAVYRGLGFECLARFTQLECLSRP